MQHTYWPDKVANKELWKKWESHAGWAWTLAKKKW